MSGTSFVFVGRRSKPGGFDELYAQLNAAERRKLLADIGTASERAMQEAIEAWMLALPTDLKLILLGAICQIVEGIKCSGGDLSAKPVEVRHNTSLESAAAAQFLCDLASRENFEFDVQSGIVTHRRPNARHQMVLRCPDYDELDSDMSDADRKLRLMDLLADYPGGRDSVLVVAYAFGRILAAKEGRVDISLGELLRMDGVVTDKSGATKREQWERALMYHATFRAIRDWEVWGTRTWGQGGEKESVVSHTQLFHYDGRSFAGGQDSLPGMMGIPVGFTLRDSDLSARIRETSTGQCADGLLKLAQLPRQRLQGDWAASIGLATMFYVRVEGNRTGGVIHKSRKSLLTRYAPNTHPSALLESDTPQRAVKAMSDALRLLSDIGLIRPVEQPVTERGRYWTEEWLNETITVVAAGDLAAHAGRLHADAVERAAPVRRTRGGKR